MLNMLSLGSPGSPGSISCGDFPMCMEVGAHATSPDRWIGFDDRDGVEPYGDRKPRTLLGIPVRLHNFDTSDGSAYIRLGEDEDTQIPNVYELTYTYEGYGEVTYAWVGADNRYALTDQALCDYMLTQVGNVVGFEQPLPYAAYLRIRIVGRISSFTRAGDFEVLVDGVPLIYDVDFKRYLEAGIIFTSAEIDQFMQGLNVNSDPIPNNGSGFMDILFAPGTRKIDDITISGRPTVDSTQFRFTMYDSNGIEILRTDLIIVTTKVTVPVNVDLT